mmetsp:Transcript_53585/g.136017  ORF Transcript_53585/g.136017 Transcript_53585/m.136017 type:complete len:128 (-) Transcript_53585:1-384(-)
MGKAHPFFVRMPSIPETTTPKFVSNKIRPRVAERPKLSKEVFGKAMEPPAGPPAGGSVDIAGIGVSGTALGGTIDGGARGHRAESAAPITPSSVGLLSGCARPSHDRLDDEEMQRRFLAKKRYIVSL